jgi:DNA invertase Pin-like site-specific DNA recombinase
MLTILGGLAEFERSLIKARTDVDIKRAREAGIRFGRPPKLTRHSRSRQSSCSTRASRSRRWHGSPMSIRARSAVLHPA